MSITRDLIDRLRLGPLRKGRGAPSEPAAPAAPERSPAALGPVFGRTEDSGNRIIAGRLEFMNQFAHLARGKRNWQLTAFISLGLLTLVTVSYIRLASTAQITPYVVEVDALGQARAFGPAETTLRPGDPLVIHQLSLFIRNLRTVYQDPLAQKDMVVRAYAYVDASAERWLNDYFRRPENDPRLLAQQFSRRVEVTSVIRVPESDTWKVSWTEIETPGSAGTERRSAWEGYLTVTEVPPATAASIEYNPLGLYITALNWTKVASE